MKSITQISQYKHFSLKNLTIFRIREILNEMDELNHTSDFALALDNLPADLIKLISSVSIQFRLNQTVSPQFELTLITLLKLMVLPQWRKYAWQDRYLELDMSFTNIDHSHKQNIPNLLVNFNPSVLQDHDNFKEFYWWGHLQNLLIINGITLENNWENLKYLTSLRNLGIIQTNSTRDDVIDETFEKKLIAVTTLTNLTSLSTYIHEPLNIFNKSIRSLTNLNSLEISNSSNHLEKIEFPASLIRLYIDHGFRSSSLELTNLCKLTNLQALFTELKFAGEFESLFKTLGELTNLKVLHLLLRSRQQKIVLFPMNNLICLNLSYNSLDNNSIESICENAKFLQAINLRNCNLKNLSLETFYNFYKLLNLTFCDLRNNSLEDKHADILMSVFSNLRSIRNTETDILPICIFYKNSYTEAVLNNLITFFNLPIITDVRSRYLDLGEICDLNVSTKFSFADIYKFNDKYSIIVKGIKNPPSFEAFIHYG